METCAEVVQQLFAEAKKSYKESGDLTDEVLSAFGCTDVALTAILAFTQNKDGTGVSKLLLLEEEEEEDELVLAAATAMKRKRRHSLNFVFQAPLQHALDLVDRQTVTLLRSPSGRCLYQVIGSSGTPYFCFTVGQYCSCPAFHYSIFQRGDYIMCKHVLAIRLCEAMDRCKTLDVSDAEITAAILSMD